MKVNEVIFEGEILEGSGIQKWVRSDLRPKLKGGAYFHSKAYLDKALQAPKGSMLHTAAWNSPQRLDFEWNTKANRRKIRTAVGAGIKGAQKYAQKHNPEKPFVPKVKADYTSQMYPTD